MREFGVRQVCLMALWVLNRPNDLTDIELHAELTPPLALCCARAPSMVHISKNGNVIGSFDAPQGHGMDVDSQGFVYIGQDTVRKYDPKIGKVVAEIARVPEMEGAAAPEGRGQAPRVRGRGGAGPVAGFIGGARGTPNPDVQAKQAGARAVVRRQPAEAISRHTIRARSWDLAAPRDSIGSRSRGLRRAAGASDSPACPSIAM
jgi:hypothetical protein